MKRMIAIGMMAIAAGVISYAACAAIDTAIATHEQTTRSVIWGQCWSGPIWSELDARLKSRAIERLEFARGSKP